MRGSNNLLYVRMLLCCLCCVMSLQVDKHIRRLDADLARFEAELKEKPPGTSSGKMKTQKDGKAIKDKPSKDKGGLSY